MLDLSSLLQPSEPHPFDSSHVTMVYTALACLLILGDDLSRVNCKAVLAGVRNLQLENGCFRCTAGGGESDMRFVYSASAVCYILQDWSGMDTDKAVEYIKMSQVGYLVIIIIHVVTVWSVPSNIYWYLLPGYNLCMCPHTHTHTQTICRAMTMVLVRDHI